MLTCLLSLYAKMFNDEVPAEVVSAARVCNQTAALVEALSVATWEGVAINDWSPYAAPPSEGTVFPIVGTSHARS
jgi:hypothetical protein